jgi:hypothetical protein
MEVYSKVGCHKCQVSGQSHHKILPREDQQAHVTNVRGNRPLVDDEDASWRHKQSHDIGSHARTMRRVCPVSDIAQR